MVISPLQTDTKAPAANATPAVNPAESVSGESFDGALAAAGIAGGKTDLDPIFDAAGRRYNLPPNLIKAVAKTESNFRPDATSKVGAMGIMQLMPGTARYLGVVDPYDPEQNIMGGAKYLREMLDKYNGDLQLALAAYNAGPGTISKNGGVPLQSQLSGYIPKVLGYFNGGNIRAGAVSYSGGLSSPSSDTTALNFSKDALAQMLLYKIISMQMDSSGEDKDSVY